MNKSKSTFASDHGRNPVAGQDYDPDKISSQDDYDYFTPANPIKKLQSMVAESGTQKAVAEELGISQVYLSDILAGRREISASVARKLGFERRTDYIPTFTVTVSPDGKIHGDQIGAGLAKIERERAGA